MYNFHSTQPAYWPARFHATRLLDGAISRNAPIGRRDFTQRAYRRRDCKQGAVLAGAISRKAPYWSARFHAARLLVSAIGRVLGEWGQRRPTIGMGFLEICGMLGLLKVEDVQLAQR